MSNRPSADILAGIDANLVAMKGEHTECRWLLFSLPQYEWRLIKLPASGNYANPPPIILSHLSEFFSKSCTSLSNMYIYNFESGIYY